MKYITVKGLKMAYQEEGEGAPIVFLHGNPTLPTFGETWSRI